MKTLRLAIAFILAGAALAAQAAAPSSESVEKLLQVMRVQAQLDTLFTQTMPAMQNAMKQSLAAEFPSSDEAQRAFDAAQPRINALLREEMSWDKLKPGFVAMYTETFTQEEVDGLVAFYQTPVGAALLDKMPQLMQRSMLLTQQRFGPLMRRMMEITKEEEARQKGGAKP